MKLGAGEGVGVSAVQFAPVLHSGIRAAELEDRYVMCHHPGICHVCNTTVEFTLGFVHFQAYLPVTSTTSLALLTASTASVRAYLLVSCVVFANNHRWLCKL